MAPAQPLSVIKYDAVVRLLTSEPDLPHEEVAERCRVALATVERVWDGKICRPPVVVLDRLAKPRRCLECGVMCSDWPCVSCEMRRLRRRKRGHTTTRFQYRNQSK
jgi:hypothetical protein